MDREGGPGGPWVHALKRLRGHIPRSLLVSGLTIAVAGGRLASVTGEVRPAGIAALYAVPRGTTETARVALYPAGGSRPMATVGLGPLGLVGQLGTMASRGMTWQATTGWRVVWGRAGRILRITRAPRGRTWISVAWANRVLYGVSASWSGRSVRIERWSDDVDGDGRAREEIGSVSLVRSVPAGIVQVWSSRSGAVATVIQPGHLAWYPLSHRAEIRRVAGVEASFWFGFPGFRRAAAFSTRAGTLGMIWVGRRIHRVVFANPSRAILGMTDAQRVWGISTVGMVPLENGRFAFPARVPWPGPMPTTIALAESPGSWCLVLGGPGQGYWFDTRGGWFGPPFRLRLPAGAVIRAVVPLTTR